MNINKHQIRVHPSTRFLISQVIDLPQTEQPKVILGKSYTRGKNNNHYKNSQTGDIVS